MSRKKLRRRPPACCMKEMERRGLGDVYAPADPWDADLIINPAHCEAAGKVTCPTCRTVWQYDTDTETWKAIHAP